MRRSRNVPGVRRSGTSRERRGHGLVPSRVHACHSGCYGKAVMSPFGKVKVSPFGVSRGCFVERGGAVEHAGVGSCGGDPAGGGEAADAARGGGAVGLGRAPGEAAGGAVPGARGGGLGFGTSRQALEQRDRRGGASRDSGFGAGSLLGLRAEVRVREAGGGARPSGVARDAAEVDGGGGAVAGEGAPGAAHASAAAAAGVRGGILVQIDGSPHAWFEDRGPECVPVVFVDDASSRLLAGGLLRGGDAAGVHDDAARAPGGAWSAGGVLRGPLRRVPGEPARPGGGADAVWSGAEDAGHRPDQRRQPAGGRAAWSAPTRRCRTGW